MKLVSAVVLIMVLGFTGFSQEQNNTRETADELLGKFFEYFVKEDIENAVNYLFKAVELDPTKKVYLDISVLWNNGNYAEALKLLEQRKDQSPGGNEEKVIQILTAETHSRWALDFKKKYQYVDAIEHYKAAYVIDIIYRHKYASVALINIGFLYDALGQKQKALEYYEKVLPILQEIEDKAHETVTLSNLMVTWDEMNKGSLAIFYGKQSVSRFQQLRLHISGLETDIKTTYLKSREDVYRDLASLLVTAASSQYHELYLKPVKTPQELRQLSFLEKNLSAGREAYAQYLDGLKKAFFSCDETSKKARPETGIMIEHAAALQTTLRGLDQGEGVRSAAIHYLVTGNKVIAILTTPHTQTSFENQVESKELNSMIHNYRLALLEEKPDHRGVKLIKEPSRAVSLTRLYEIIFQQVDEQLKIYGATNLLVYLDGVLRYLPLPDLWDGEHFLVQRYRMG